MKNLFAFSQHQKKQRNYASASLIFPILLNTLNKSLKCLHTLCRSLIYSGILQHLPDGYHVFNDFVACGRHVDHVVVGSGGVFAVETKFWLGRVTLEDGHILLDGQLTDRPPLRQVLKEAEAVRNELAKRGWRGDVTPVLAFASDTFEAKIAESGGVVIINSNALEASFASVRTVLPPAELDRLVRLMENG